MSEVITVEIDLAENVFQLPCATTLVPLEGPHRVVHVRHETIHPRSSLPSLVPAAPYF
jgi:hypothetical protein